jgi:hypothetical protein
MCPAEKAGLFFCLGFARVGKEEDLMTDDEARKQLKHILRWYPEVARDVLLEDLPVPSLEPGVFYSRMDDERTGKIVVQLSNDYDVWVGMADPDEHALPMHSLRFTSHCSKSRRTGAALRLLAAAMTLDEKERQM